MIKSVANSAQQFLQVPSNKLFRLKRQIVWLALIDAAWVFLTGKYHPFFGHVKLFPTRVHLWFKLYSLMLSDLLPKLVCVITPVELGLPDSCWILVHYESWEVSKLVRCQSVQVSQTDLQLLAYLWHPAPSPMQSSEQDKIYGRFLGLWASTVI